MAATLPELDKLDREALKALVRTQQETLETRDREIEHLKLLLAKLRRAQFGRRSEKLDRQIEQLELFIEELETARAAAPPPPQPQAAEP
ncbi:MAG: IS66 family transposase, partial [Terriglobales bacterium]